MRIVLYCAALSVAALAAMSSTPAAARAFVRLDVGLPLYAPYYAPPPVVYAQPPVYYAPPPVIYSPPPVIYSPPPVIVAPPPTLQRNSASQNWYYCDDSRAYYPTVTSCSSGWREVAPPPANR